MGSQFYRRLNCRSLSRELTRFGLPCMGIVWQSRHVNVGWRQIEISYWVSRRIVPGSAAHQGTRVSAHDSCYHDNLGFYSIPRIRNVFVTKSVASTTTTTREHISWPAQSDWSLELQRLMLINDWIYHISSGSAVSFSSWIQDSHSLVTGRVQPAT